MIDKTKYPKTAEDFEKWLKSWITSVEIEATKFIFNFKGNVDVIKFFYSLPEEMQAGCYLSYFDGCKIRIRMNRPDHFLWSVERHDDWGYIAEGIEGECLFYNTKNENSRISAIKEAIKKASEIREKQLKPKP